MQIRSIVKPACCRRSAIKRTNKVVALEGHRRGRRPRNGVGVRAPGHIRTLIDEVPRTTGCRAGGSAKFRQRDATRMPQSPGSAGDGPPRVTARTDGSALRLRPLGRSTQSFRRTGSAGYGMAEPNHSARFYLSEAFSVPQRLRPRGVLSVVIAQEPPRRHPAVEPEGGATGRGVEDFSLQKS
jgi:hypothetical protein